MKALGWSEATCNVVDLDKHQEKKLNVLMNSQAISGTWDELKLSEILHELELDLDYFPLRLNELAPLDLSTHGSEDEKPELDESSEPKSKLGEIYQLGKHKLACADATDFGFISDFINGQRIAMMVTSPPYADTRDYNIGDFDWDKLMNGISDSFQILNDADIIINLGQLHRDGQVWFYWKEWLKHTKEVGYPLFGLYIWDKLNPIPGDYSGRLALCHEWLFHFRTGKGSAIKSIASKHVKGSGANTFRQKDGSLKKATGRKETMDQDWKLHDSVFRVLPEKHNTTDHPAVFSVAFVVELMKPWSKPGDIIYDPFIGSGTTLIGAEQTGRICYGVEVDPKYCDMVRKRYAKFIGKEDSWEAATPALPS